MRKICICFLVCCLVFLPGCQLLTYPLMLMQQLIPLVIQYAPLLLMLVSDEPVEEQTKDLAQQQELFKNYVAQKLRENPENLLPMANLLEQKLAKGRYQGVLIVPPEIAADPQRLEDLYQKLAQKGRVSYHFTYYDASDPLHGQNTAELLQQAKLPIWFSGPLAPWLETTQVQADLKDIIGESG